MTNQSIYDSALRLVCELASTTANTDYEERAGYLLGTVCNDCAALDRIWRKYNDGGDPPTSIGMNLSLSSAFPLSDIFAPAVAYYLASMFVIDENDEMSEKFFDLYADAISSVRMSLPLKSESTVNRYPGIL